MHGYQLMQVIADRSGGRWTPSPGAIYPALNLLEDEGLVSVAAESGRKVATLTDAGRALVTDNRETWADPYSGFAASRPGPDLRSLLEQLHGATRQVGRAGTTEQVAAAAEILSAARRQMYLLLAEGPAVTDE
jgi:DNA-binding PadR family transcriptional regulator